MTLLGALRRIEGTFAWSFSGFVLAAVFGALAIYTEFFRSRSPHITYDVLSNTPVLTTHEDVPALRILYKDIDTRQTRQIVSVVSVRVLNDGESDILKTFYEDRDPLGLSVTSGQILEPRVSSASNDYLRANAQCTLIGTNALVLTPVILEPGESFVLRLLILHPDGTAPDVTPRGKVAGVRRIAVVHSFTAAQTPSIWRAAFLGRPMVQLARLLAYSLGLLALLLAVFGSIAGISATFATRRRRRQVREFRRDRKAPVPSEGEALLTLYEKTGIHILISMSRWLKRDPQVTHTVQPATSRERPHLEDIDERLFEDVIVMGRSPSHAMLEAGLLERATVDGKLPIVPQVQALLEELLDYLIKHTHEITK